MLKIEENTSGGGKGQALVGQTEQLLAGTNSLDARKSLNLVVHNSLRNVEHINGRRLEHITHTIGHREVKGVFIYNLNARSRNLSRNTLYLIQEVEITLKTLSRRNGIRKLKTNSHIKKHVNRSLGREVIRYIELEVRYFVIDHCK